MKWIQSITSNLSHTLSFLMERARSECSSERGGECDAKGQTRLEQGISVLLNDIRVRYHLMARVVLSQLVIYLNEAMPHTCYHMSLPHGKLFFIGLVAALS